MNKKIALVLSGGGARGNAHIGVIEELLGQGFEISSVTGTSMGSLVGGAYAYGKLEVLKEWMLSLDRRRVFSLVDFTLSRHGIVKGDKVFNAMKEFIPDTRIETLPIPFAAIAVDLVTKHEVVFREGSLFNAIRSSVAIPTVMTPVKSNGSLLVDGGVLNNIPISHARRQKGDLLVVANVNANVPVSLPEFNKEEDEGQVKEQGKKSIGFPSQLQRVFHNSTLEKRHHEQDVKLSYFEIINRTIALMTYRMDQMNLKYYNPDILIEVSRDTCGTYDFFKAKELIEAGRQATRKSLDIYKKG